jgi:XTP/dITP diphosphohydrolase
MKRILFATSNKGKVKEVTPIFGESKIELISLIGVHGLPEIIEDGLTFEDNAKIKAKAIYNILKVPVIADDSGLVVEQLKGAPGIYSSRYAGENATDDDNNKKLLKELKKFPHPHIAKFYCCAVFYDGKEFLVSYGEVHGKIIDKERGTNGFGYDPLFLPDGFDKTTAELSLEEKNKISHRAKAFKNLKTLMNHKVNK